MWDDDDASFLALLWPSGGGWLGLLLGILVVGAGFYVACRNDQSCEARSCPAGQHALLIHEECLCVEPAP